MTDPRTRQAFSLHRLDDILEQSRPFNNLSGLRRFIVEFLYFGIKEARACLFVGLFFLAVFLVPRGGILGVARYDILLFIALAIQAIMLIGKLETWDEAKAIALFHALGFALEVFKTSGALPSWSYPDPGLSKLFGVPLFSGFMYAGVGSYIIQAWRLFDLRVRHHPPYWMTALVAVAIYANFFTHHYIGDYRWYIAACALGLYARTTVIFRPYDKDRWMPLFVAFILIGFFIWLAENISTFFGIWRYPNQMNYWSMVHLGKWSSWSLLVIMSFVIVTQLKHIKTRIHIPQ
ncbi:DUF817 family protein [Agrobacterium vitis]|uniref:DUF817 family protein n=1 Tax=Agrobacterium vitis TaxID=373 RepID=A0AAE4WHP2_AGRVI|nr:DUF817 domain-containing protein [Agrobacterium vitis]MCF1500600.1 DUF817 domain-containing protein [Allorhizobium sp. Av2]MCM2441912.1 DUF817 domain-containing protein [Agrobacterium vitis]MUO80967.1 DUF817 family protein [Agrobacterium vitis]MUO96873.1 DUF817 family protein [Agrobacterium vitis]MUP06506.1 DUF817 family protein [Agrobacterium vitis]